MEDKRLLPQSVNLIVKRGLRHVGLELEAFSAQGLRARHLSEAAWRGIALLGGDATLRAPLGPAGGELLQ